MKIIMEMVTKPGPCILFFVKCRVIKKLIATKDNSPIFYKYFVVDAEKSFFFPDCFSVSVQL